MSIRPDFTPVFGPNGAVMNAPSMTPEMRGKIQRSARPPSRADVLRHLPLLSFIAITFVLVYVYGDDLHSLLQSSPWWAGVFAGAVMAISAVVALQSVRRILSRWELLPPHLKQPSLRAPIWGRCLIAAADSLATVGYALASAAFIIDLERAYPLVLFSAAAAAIAAVMLGAGLRWLADRLGWQWRVEVR